MKKSAIALAFLSLCAFSASAQLTMPLTLQQTISLPGVTGKFDHLAIDTADNLLFITAGTNHSVEVIDLKTDKIRQSITGLGKPHGLAWDAATGSLYVSDGLLGELRVYKGTPLALAGKIKLSDDADDMAYDETRHLLFVGHGGKDAANPPKVAIVNTRDFSLVANVSTATHPEGLAIDPQSGRVFANIADSGEVAAVDPSSKSVVAHWKLTKAADNVPMAFDGEDQLLFVACRTPGTVIALDASTGNEIASQPTADGADDLFYDPALRRVYVISGAGEVDSYRWTKRRIFIHSKSCLPPLERRRPCLFRRRICSMSAYREWAESRLRFASTRRERRKRQALSTTRSCCRRGRRIEIRCHRQPPWSALAHRQD